MSRRELLGFATVACVACCIGPILGVLGAIGALGVVASIFIGVAGLAIATCVIAAIIVVRRRRANRDVTARDPVAVELTSR